MSEHVSLNDIMQDLAVFGCKVEPCGSRVTCVPYAETSDHDFLVEIVPNSAENVAKLVNVLSGLGFDWEGDEHYQDAASTFMSWRRDDINLIVTADSTFAERHRAATAVCKRLNLLNKPDRIALFQAVLYGNQWDGEGVGPRNPDRDFAVKVEEVAF